MPGIWGSGGRTLVVGPSLLKPQGCLRMTPKGPDITATLTPNTTLSLCGSSRKKKKRVKWRYEENYVSLFPLLFLTPTLLLTCTLGP